MHAIAYLSFESTAIALQFNSQPLENQKGCLTEPAGEVP